ncbi:MAG: hypothetical protein GY796_14845 [Chloroflexi bacterium]|nr:hypothetical protein [Chloroflexota bacterium]
MENQTIDQNKMVNDVTKQKNVVLSLKVTGAKECIMDLLEQMDTIEGFSVLEGSFTTSLNKLYMQ